MGSDPQSGSSGGVSWIVAGSDNRAGCYVSSHVSHRPKGAMPACWRVPLVAPRLAAFLSLLVICLLFTSYEYIFNLSIVNISPHNMLIGIDVKVAKFKKLFNSENEDTRDTKWKGNINVITEKTIKQRRKSLSAEKRSSVNKLSENMPVNSSRNQVTKPTNLQPTRTQPPPPPSTSRQSVVNPQAWAKQVKPPQNLTQSLNSSSLPQCTQIPLALQGRLKIHLKALNWEAIKLNNKAVMLGGRFQPQNCTSRHKVALIIPYRNREEQLKIFLNHIHPILRRQDLDYGIYVINQGGKNSFNRAMLLNVGYVEAMKDYNWTCAIFHDVDLLPEDDRNLYTCPSQPRHMSVAVNKFKYKLPYKTLFGGIAAINVKQFQELNGFSNQFWGWGGEDDDMSKRIRFHGLKITRYKPEIARYTMMKHKQERANKERAKVLRTSHRRYKTDGLNNLAYRLLGKTRELLYTNVTVTLQQTPPGSPAKMSKN